MGDSIVSLLTFFNSSSLSVSTSCDQTVMSFLVCWQILTTVISLASNFLSGNRSEKLLWSDGLHVCTEHSTLPYIYNMCYCNMVIIHTFDPKQRTFSMWFESSLHAKTVKVWSNEEESWWDPSIPASDWPPPLFTRIYFELALILMRIDKSLCAFNNRSWD
jgi:hypothetical protein